MKNIQVIDAALNCTFSFFQATDEEFHLLFPEHLQDIQFAEDLEKMPNYDRIIDSLREIWERPVRKQDVMGVHGTLFFKLERYKKYYRENREAAVIPSAINAAQRNLFAAESARGTILD